MSREGPRRLHRIGDRASLHAVAGVDDEDDAEVAGTGGADRNDRDVRDRRAVLEHVHSDRSELLLLRQRQDERAVGETRAARLDDPQPPRGPGGGGRKSREQRDSA